MQRSVFRKLAWVIVACAVLFAIIVALGRAWSPEPSAEDERVDLGLIDDARRPPTPDARAGTAREPSLQDLGPSEEGWIRRVDPETGRLSQEFRYGRLHPREEGLFDIDRPEARLYLAPDRVIHLVSDTGYFVAPERYPRSGQFRDNLVITLYESDDGRRPDLSPDSPDAVMKIMLDEATFDVTLGQIQSQSRVELLAPQARFLGEGLRLIYNEIERQIDYLEITEGDSLVYRPARGEMEPRSGDGDGPAEPGAPPVADDDDAPFYRVVFERDIVASGGGQRITADHLEAIFTLDMAETEDEQLGGDSERGAAAEDAEPPTRPDFAAMTEPQADDLVLRWNGRMIMRPHDAPPPGAAGRAFIALRGAPVIGRDPDGNTLRCARLEYIDGAQRVRAIGSTAHPLTIDSPELGIIEAGELVVALAGQQAALLGEGVMRGHAEGERGGGLPSAFAIKWTDRVLLEFSDPDRPDGGIERVEFRGDVAATDPRFSVQAQTLVAGFEAGADGDRQLNEIAASGGTSVRADEGRLSARRMRLALAEDDSGKLRPTRLQADGEVRVADGRENLRAGIIDVTLAAAEDATGDDDVARVAVTSAIAMDAVELTTQNGMRIFADKMESNAADGSAFLIGSPVRIERDDTELRVLELNIEDDGRIAHGKGSGEFRFTEARADGTGGRRIIVQWSEQMRFDDERDLVRVTGDVVAVAAGDDAEENRLTAGQATLELTEPPGVEAARADDAPFITDRELVLRRGTARGGVGRQGSRWGGAGRRKLRQRLRIAGPVLVFENATEQARVEGPGTMLIEDYRSKVADAETAIPFTGRGQTLFTWTRRLTLDGAETNIIFEGGVSMTHRPADESELLDLQANRLVADMHGVGGVQAMQFSEIDSVDIDHIEAVGGVQVRHGDRMISAHRLYYLDDQQRLLLEAPPGREVEVIRLDQPRPLRSAGILWDLANDRIELYEPKY